MSRRKSVMKCEVLESRRVLATVVATGVSGAPHVTASGHVVWLNDDVWTLSDKDATPFAFVDTWQGSTANGASAVASGTLLFNHYVVSVRAYAGAYEFTSGSCKSRSASASTTVTAAVEYTVTADSPGENGAKYILGIETSGRESADFNVAGASRYSPKADYSGTGYDEFYEVVVGSTFSINVAASVSVSTQSLELSEDQQHGFITFGLMSGNVYGGVGWADDGVVVAYDVRGDLLPAPQMQLVWQDPATGAETVAHSFKAADSGDLANGTHYEITVPASQLGPAPFLQGNLVLRADPSVPATYRDSFRSSVGFTAAVEFELIAPGSTDRWFQKDTQALKNEIYSLRLKAKNHSPVALGGFSVGWREWRSSGTNPLKDPSPGPRTGSVTVPSLGIDGTAEVAVGPFVHNWEWIPDENPILSADGKASTLQSLLSSLTFAFGDLKREMKKSRINASLLDKALQLLDVADLLGNLYLDTEANNTFTCQLTVPREVRTSSSVISQDVVLGVAANRLSALAGYATSKTLSDFYISVGLEALVASAVIPPPWNAIQATVAVGAFASALSYLNIAAALYEVAKDPPDSDYTTRVEVDDDIALTLEGDLPTRDQGSLVRLITAYREASHRAQNKADGAELAGDAYWQAEQLKSVASFSLAASALECRLGVLDSIYPSQRSPVTDQQVQAFAKQVEGSGLPSEFVNGLREQGFSDDLINALRIGVSKVTTVSAPSASEVSSGKQVASSTGLFEGIAAVVQSTRIRVERLGAEVRDVDANVFAVIQSSDQTIESSYDNEVTSEDDFKVIDEQVRRLLDVLVSTNNLVVVEPFLQRAASALTQLYLRSTAGSDVSAAIDSWKAAGGVSAAVSAELKGLLTTASGEFLANPQSPGTVVADFRSAVEGYRGAGLDAEHADQLLGWADFVTGRSQLNPDSFVIEAGRDFFLDVLANDTATVGSVVAGSLAPVVTGPMAAAVVAEAGKLKVNAGPSLIGKQVVTYSAFDDHTFLRTTGQVAIEVVDREPDAPTDITITSAAIAENQPGGSVVGTLAAVDPDLNNTFTYSIVSGAGDADNAWFRIDGNSLKAATAFNFEARNSYSVRVRTTDQGGLSVEKAFSISVTDVLEPPTAPAAMLPSALQVTEDQVSALVFPEAPFTDADSVLSSPIRVTMSVPDGVLTASSTSDVAVSGNAKSRTFAGTIAALNSYFTSQPGRITYQPTKDSVADRAITVKTYETYGKKTLSATTVGKIAVTPVNDAPVAAAPKAFSVTEDVASSLVWGKKPTPVIDIDSATVTVTLEVPAGEIVAASVTGVAIGGLPTARTITGAVAAVNTYLATKGNVTYRTALDDTRAVTLTTRVSDGADTAVVTSQINVKPVNDAPTIAAAISLAGQLTGGFIDITADTILANGKVQDVDSQKLSIVVQSVLAGTLQRQVGAKWVPITAKSSLAQRKFSPGQMLRWTPPAGGAGAVQAFQVKAADESLQSETLSTVAVAVG